MEVYPMGMTNIITNFILEIHTVMMIDSTDGFFRENAGKFHEHHGKIDGFFGQPID